MMHEDAHVSYQKRLLHSKIRGVRTASFEQQLNNLSSISVQFFFIQRNVMASNAIYFNLSNFSQSLSYLSL
jgi:hypothetical protein